VDCTPEEIRVLGCLIEKQRTTPEQYPLSINSLRLACNQSTNREPVVSYSETDLRAPLESLNRRGWIRLASGAGSRAVKYRQLFDEAIGVDDAQVSVLAMLMLRGPQTVNELKTRTERMHRFESLEDVDRTLRELQERELVRFLGRRPGQREDRWAHLLGAEEPTLPDATDRPPPPRVATAALEERVRRLEEQMAELLETIERLRG